MHDGQFWIYIIVGLIYFLTRLSKKKTQADKSRQARPNRPQRSTSAPSTANRPTPRPAQRPQTFEDMLREIMEAKKEAASPKPTPPPQPTYVDYDDNLGDEKEDLEKVDIDRSKDEEMISYAEGLREAFKRPSLEQASLPTPSKAREGRFKSFENSAETQIFDDYLRDFRDPEGFKRAFILSELLNRKHF